MQQQPMQPAASPVTMENHPLNMASSVPAADPMARKQVVQDLMAQMQGTYNFMQVGACSLAMWTLIQAWCSSPLCYQDSMLEFDGQAIDPAIVSAQPMKPTQNIDLQQMVCPPGRFAKQSTDAVVWMLERTFSG